MQTILNAFESGIFPKGKQAQEKGRPSNLALVANASDRKQLKILTRKQMLKRLPIALAQVKAGNTFQNLLNEICQIIYSLYRAKEVTKNVYKNIMNSIKL